MIDLRLEQQANPTIGLIGTGTIGFGWANVFRRLDLPLVLFDANPSAAEAMAERLMEDDDGGGAAVSVASSLEQLAAEVAYVQESTPESLEAKRSVFAELDAVAPPEVIVGSSTSSFAVSSMAADVRHPGRFIVVHPTNPPHVVPLVELVPGPQTSESVTRLVREWMVRLGQSPIVVRREVAGFVLNRLQFALTREAFRLVREGVVSVADVDKTVSDGLALRWAFLGPYGVEATSAANIQDFLTKFGDLMTTLFAEVGQPFDGVTARDVELAVDGASRMIGDTTQEELTRYRDSMVLKLRELKEQTPAPLADVAE